MPVSPLYIFLAGVIITTLGGCGGGSSSPSSQCKPSDIQIDFPVNYLLSSTELRIQTTGGYLKTLIGPWGAHVPAYTGHAEGDAKSNWMALLVSNRSELTELKNYGLIPGTCEKGDVCGLPLSVIQLRIPTYISPNDDFEVSEVYVEAIDASATTSPFGNRQWHVNGTLCGYRLSFGHLQGVSETLRQKIISSGYSDPNLDTTVGKNLITGAPVILNMGDEIAQPQIRMTEVPGYPGYYTGWGSIEAVPWAQMEYTINDMNLEAKEGGEIPMYHLLPQSIQDKLLGTIVADFNDPDSFRFDQPWISAWLARSELVLYTRPLVKRYDYSSIYAGLGGWWERSDTTCLPYKDPKCDQMFSIFKIQKGGPVYDPSFYYSPEQNYIVAIEGTPAKPYGEYFGDVISPVSPGSTSGTMVIRWREPGGNLFQAIAYYLDPAVKLLKIRWGITVPDLNNVVTPTVPTNTDVCNGTTLTCQSHDTYWTGKGGPL